MGRPPKSESRDVRKLLLDEAMRVIAKQGEQALRTKAVASAAGVTEPALFHYFGSREGLIEEAQAERFKSEQVDLIEQFRDAVMKCTTRAEFIASVSAAMENITSPPRRPIRAMRINVAGSATTRPKLAARLADAQRASNAVMVDALTYAQQRKWMRADLDLNAFAMWFVGQTTGRYFAELSADEGLLREVDRLMTEATFSMLGITQHRTRKR